MSLSRTGYVSQFEEICPGKPALGKASVLPWDAEIFGFPVGCYQIGVDRLDTNLEQEFSGHFLSWSKAHAVRMCMCAIPASNSAWKLSLPKAGFHFVDFALQVSLNGLQTARLPEARSNLREVGQEDWEPIEAIAARAFHHGRYHADPSFPKELANLRYRRWIKNARAAESPSNRVFVMDDSGEVLGFYHLAIDGNACDLRLAAVKPELRGTMLGFELYVAILHILRALGIRRVVTSISAANIAVVNLFSMLGFSFVGPEVIYHWHAEDGHITK